MDLTVSPIDLGIRCGSSTHTSRGLAQGTQTLGARQNASYCKSARYCSRVPTDRPGIMVPDALHTVRRYSECISIGPAFTSTGGADQASPSLSEHDPFVTVLLPPVSPSSILVEASCGPSQPPRYARPWAPPTPFQRLFERSEQSPSASGMLLHRRDRVLPPGNRIAPFGSRSTTTTSSYQ